MNALITRMRAKVRPLKESVSGIALIEFAVSLPFFLGLGMYGTEVARMAIIRMQVSQLALSVADNASRLGQTDNTGVQPTVNETDIDSVMTGATQQGLSIDLQGRGRVILSSLEYHELTGRQYFHWQRCRGTLAATSAYGDQYTKNGLGTQRIYGVGPTIPQLTALSGTAVMVAEVYYNFEGIFGSTFVKPQVFRQEAAFLVRDLRNLNGAVTPGTGTSQSPCPIT